MNEVILSSLSIVATVWPFLMGNPSNTSSDGTEQTVEWTVKRVGGDLEARVARAENESNVYWRSGRCIVEAPLPEGYPAPTPPGAIEIKKYPSVRRAELPVGTESEASRNRGFFPLFQHIKQREIAMTSPVEMDYRDWTPGSSPAESAAIMSFLYRTPDLGPTGSDGDIRIVDTESVTVLAIGIRGPYSMSSIQPGLQRLEQWLASQSEWEIAGDARTFYYNGPYIRDAHKWSEVQIPVRRAGTSSNSGTVESPQ